MERLPHTDRRDSNQFEFYHRRPLCLLCADQREADKIQLPVMEGLSHASHSRR
jgi:hypothetical protein